MQLERCGCLQPSSAGHGALLISMGQILRRANSDRSIWEVFQQLDTSLLQSCQQERLWVLDLSKVMSADMALELLLLESWKAVSTDEEQDWSKDYIREAVRGQERQRWCKAFYIEQQKWIPFMVRGFLL